MIWRVGEWVEVRSKAEILATLDRTGACEGLPFMPDMLQHCGRQFRIYRNAHKTCDTVSGRYDGLAVERCVHLATRCGGADFDGCQAECLLFWKTAWLRPVQGSATAARLAEAESDFKRATATGAGITEEDLRAASRTSEGGRMLYRCQATALLEFTKPLPRSNPAQYVDAYRSGNFTARQLLAGLAFMSFAFATRASSPQSGGPGRWLYDRLCWIWGGHAFPIGANPSPDAKPAPRIDLALKPGDQVRVKSHPEILATLGPKGANLGLTFDAEMVPYCGKTFRVRRYVDRFVDEKTGLMRTLATPAVMLEGTVCRSLFSGRRTFCPREIYCWWREVWIERTADDAQP